MPLRKRIRAGRRRSSGGREKPPKGAGRPAAKRRRPVSRNSLVKAPLKVAYDLGAILLELVRIPLRLWLRLAELAGAGVLATWRAAWPLMLAFARAGRRLLAAAERAVTPARTAIVVALLAVAALAASQFVDYRAVEIGAPDYKGITAVAPPPAVNPADPRSAHGLWVIAIAAVAFAIVLIVVVGRGRRLARLLVPLGAAVVVIAIVVDAPHGLDTGQAGIAYEGARAVLRDGFGAEIAAGAVLALAGLLLTLYAPAAHGARSRRKRGLARRKRPKSARGDPRRKPLRARTPRKANG